MNKNEKRRMAQSAKQKEDTRSVKLIRAQSNQMQQLIAEKSARTDKLDNVLNDQSLSNMLGDELEKTLIEREQEREQLHERLKQKKRGLHICGKMPTRSCTQVVRMHR